MLVTNTNSFTKFNPLSLEIISNQATINIGTIGHVKHGKTTIVKTLCGIQTFLFSREVGRHAPTKLGYTNAKIYKCNNKDCPRPGCYRSFGSHKGNKLPCERPNCGGTLELIRHISFVDCPGHDLLMTTMLSGAAKMDAALLLIAGNEPCPQPQASEHLAAIEVMKLHNIIILQSKIDLITKEDALKQSAEIKSFTKGTLVDRAPVIPISAQFKFNIDVINEYIVKKVPIPICDYSVEPRFLIIRSFDINKPGLSTSKILGGVAGGSVLRGVLKIGDTIEIRPGNIYKDQCGRIHARPIFSKIVSLASESNKLDFAVPGGLIDVGTEVDPFLCHSDQLQGHILGYNGRLPPIYIELEIYHFLMRRAIGVSTKNGKKARITKLMKGETLMVNIGSVSLGGIVANTKEYLSRVILTKPTCAYIGDKIAISRKMNGCWRLIGWGIIRHGTALKLETD